MNVRCPNCQTVFRVDPAKVPEAGVRARCSECDAVFAVYRETAPPAPTPEPVVPQPVPARPAPLPQPAALRPRPAFAPPVVRPSVAPGRPAAPRGAPVRPAVGTNAEERAAPRGGAFNPFLSQDPKQKARRLARALVSDLVVYHPEKRERGLREGRLKELFDEEIKKSWEEYEEQVGKELAESTTYFNDALNEILGDGTQVF